MWMKNEDELVEEALRGNEDSFGLLLQPYRQGILNMCYRMTGNLEEAKEITQEAAIKVFRYLRKFKKGKSFKRWLYRIALNSAYDHLRKRKRQEETIDSQKNSAAGQSPSPEENLLQKEMKERIEACLLGLSPKEKAVFLLRDGEGFSIKEASKVLGSSSASVRTHLCRARQKIRANFEKVYPGYRMEVKR
jgi:RNA polymerase sigma-70 factor (ECF subfamily)